MKNKMKKYYLSVHISTRVKVCRFSEIYADDRTQTCPPSIFGGQAGLRPIEKNYFLSNISFGTSAFSGHPSGMS